MNKLIDYLFPFFDLDVYVHQDHYDKPVELVHQYQENEREYLHQIPY